MPIQDLNFYFHLVSRVLLQNMGFKFTYGNKIKQLNLLRLLGLVVSLKEFQIVKKMKIDTINKSFEIIK